jgi:hypothetical protein
MRFRPHFRRHHRDADIERIAEENERRLAANRFIWKEGDVYLIPPVLTEEQAKSVTRDDAKNAAKHAERGRRG